jgi:pimeloyl-ACP methyl ester carboxylesterase
MKTSTATTTAAWIGLLLASSPALAQSGANSSTSMLPLSSDSYFSFALSAMISLSNGGGASTGEVLRAASQITPGSFESYYGEFKFLADAIHAVGNSTTSAVSRRDAFFRSSAYYRAADFFLHGNDSDPRLTTLWASQLADFGEAIALLPVPAERVNIQTSDNFSVPVIFYPAQGTSTARDNSNKRRPTLLAGSGYDGPQEDLYHSLGVHVLARGWNFATYEGPGQPTVRRQQGLGFRPDWWSVVTPVVDYLAARDDVDMERLALEGISFGGTLAPRAASREHRFAAVLAVDGLYSLQKGLLGQFPATLTALFAGGNRTLFDYYVNAARADASTETSFRWLVDQGTWAFDTESPFDWMAQLGNYTLDGILANVTCPVFVGSGEDDTIAPGQPEDVAALLGSQGYYHKFLTELGAGEHCQIGAEAQLAQVSLDWLERVFANRTRLED